MRLSVFILLLTFSYAESVTSQSSISIDDYKRAVSYLRGNMSDKKVFNLDIEPHWLPDNTGLWYETQSPSGKTYKKITFQKNKVSPLFDHKKLADLLTKHTGETVNPDHLAFTWFNYNGPTEIEFDLDDKEFTYNPIKKQLSERPAAEENLPITEIASPDSAWIAYTEDYNLYVRSTKTDEVKQLSTDGEEGYEYASWYGWGDIMVGEGGKRPDHFSVEWSPDSKWITATVCDLRSAQKMYLLDHSIDSLYRPRLLSYYRGSPGDTAMVYENPVFFNVETGKQVSTGFEPCTHINPIEVYSSDVPGMVYLIKLERGYKELNAYAFDLTTEELTLIYSESSETNIDNFDSELAEKQGKAFILSEKSGWRQIHCLDFETMAESELTKGEYYIHGIAHIDEDNELIYFTASGREEGVNPYWANLYVISFDGNNLKILTDPAYHHSITMSEDGKRFVDNYSTAQIKTTTVLCDAADGKRLATLGQADVSKLENWSPPETFTALAHDNESTIYGAIWKPSNFDENKSYPIIDASYTGPHTQVFPRAFWEVFHLQAITELGFIVICVDGLGSSGRSKKFHDYSYGNLGGNLADHVGAIRQLSAQHSWIDTTRIGIYGHSAGGYDAGHAVLAYPDFYKVAVASSGDHDHRMEKAWWPEMYMGWPVDSAYHEQSNITMAGNLKGKLLITHGGIDENVNPSASFKLADALIKNDKEFDLLILPSQHHGYRGKYWDYFTKTRWNYFVEHLLGAEPIWDFSWE